MRLRRRTRLVLLIGIGLVVAVGVVIAGNTLARYVGVSVKPMAPQELSALLSPHYVVSAPESGGPFPTALLFSGCDGPRDNMRLWAQMLNEMGWAAIIVDSHTPRDLIDFEAWRLVCAGQLLMGSERAGDVLVALSDAREMKLVDRDRIALIGASHGGWTIMEFLAFDPPAKLPFNLKAAPEAFAEQGLDGVIGSVLIYPWCGPANRARSDGWQHAAPALFILASEDVIAPSDQCIEVIDKLERRGLPVETLMLDGANHGFDQKERSSLSPLVFDAAFTERAMDRARAFLSDLSNPAAR